MCLNSPRKYKRIIKSWSSRTNLVSSFLSYIYHLCVQDLPSKSSSISCGGIFNETRNSFASYYSSRCGSKPRVECLALLSEQFNRRSLEWHLCWRLGAVNFGSRCVYARRTRKKELAMSLGALFGFGSVIFLIVMTGAFVYGLTALRQAADRDNYRPGSAKN